MPKYFALIFLSLLGCVTHESQSEGILPPPIAKLWPTIATTDVLILGEIHDNPDHHLIQAAVIRQLSAEGKLGAVLFEHMHSDQSQQISQLTIEDLETLPQRLDWAKSGWPDFALFRPVFEASLIAQKPMIAANFPPGQAKAIYQKGYAAVFSEAEIKKLGLNKPLNAQSNEKLKQEIFAGHCGLLPPEHVESMLPIQRARDAKMAMAYALAPKTGVAVYLVGSGHARKDYGIPFFLWQSQPDLKILSLALTEMGDDKRPEKAEFYDAVVLSPAAKREDPCAGLKKTLAK